MSDFRFSKKLGRCPISKKIRKTVQKSKLEIRRSCGPTPVTPAPGLKPLPLPRARNEASSCPGIFSSTLRFYYVASSTGSPLPHLLYGHKKLVAWDSDSWQQGHAQGLFGIFWEVGSASRWSAGIDDTASPQHQRITDLSCKRGSVVRARDC